MPLTVREKEHWKERIEKRIDKAIDTLYQREGKELRQTIRQEAEARAAKRLGLDDYLKQYNQLDAQRDEIIDQMTTIANEAAKRFAKYKDTRYPHCEHTRIELLIEVEADLVEKEILQESEVGQKILQLEREREELTDTIWLATSSVQIRSLWKDFSAMVAEEPTELQKQALTYEPVDDSKSE